MNIFDKMCAVPAILLGVVFMFLGALGLFKGCNAHFALPPVLGVVPFFVGWGMCVSLVKSWNINSQKAPPRRQ